jgi:NADP-dependent 3-hydroxy acid dehydrogenase YdfG
MKKIVIVSGASGSLGEEYLKYFSNKPRFKLIGLSRREPKKKIENVEYLYCDLLNSTKLQNEINKIDFEQFSEIIFIHPVGKFAFEDRNNGNKLDKQIYDSNVLTFVNVANILTKLIEKNKKIIFCCFGSVSDKYDVPYWKSYTQSKKELRKIVKKLSENENIRGVFVNVSTVSTGNENKLRPFADKKYWLKPKKIVSKSISDISSGKSQFIELDVFEPLSSFKDNYYLDHEAIYKKWKKEMGK